MSKFCAAVVIAVFAAFVATGCGGGGSGSSSSNIASVQDTSVLNLQSSLFKDGATYQVTLANESNNSIATSSCVSVNQACLASLNVANSASYDNLALQVTQGQQLIAATLMDSSVNLLGSNTVKSIELNEITTGQYLLKVLQAVTDNTISDGEVASTIVGKLGYNSIDHTDMVYKTPIATYIMFNDMQNLTSSYYVALHSLWYEIFDNIAVNTDENPDINSSVQTTSSFVYTQKTQSLASLTSMVKSSVASVTSLVRGVGTDSKDANKTIPKECSGLKPMGEVSVLDYDACIKALGKKPEQSLFEKGAEYKDGIKGGVTAVLGVIASKKQMSAQEYANWQTASQVAGFVLKGLDLAVPGLGSILGAVKDGAFDALIQAPPGKNPYAAIETSLKSIENQLGSMTTSIDSMAKDANDRDVDKKKLAIATSLIQINAYAASFDNEVNSAKTYIKNKSVAKFNMLDLNHTSYPQWIVLYLDELKIDANDQSKSAQQRAFAQTQFNSEIATVKKWASDYQDSRKLMTTLEISAIKDSLESILKSYKRLGENLESEAKKNAASASDFSQTNKYNLIKMRQSYHMKAADLKIRLFTAYASIRAYYKALNYLRFNNPSYADSIGFINIDFKGYNSASYDDGDKSIDEYFDTLVKTANDNIDAVVSEHKIKVYAGLESYINDGIFNTPKYNGFARCEVTYWDSVNIGYKCIQVDSSGVLDGNRSLCESYIPDISAGSCLDKIGDKTENNTSRIFCTTAAKFTGYNPYKTFTGGLQLGNVNNAWVSTSYTGNSYPTDLLPKDSLNQPSLMFQGGFLYSDENGAIKDSVIKNYYLAFQYPNNTISKFDTIGDLDTPQRIITGAKIQDGDPTDPMPDGVQGMTTKFLSLGIGQSDGMDTSVVNLLASYTQINIASDKISTESYPVSVQTFVVLTSEREGNRYGTTFNSYKYYSTLGCSTSDCNIINEGSSYVRVMFDDGYGFDLLPYTNGSQGFGRYKLKYIKIPDKWLPRGDWRSRCLVDKAIFSNGWLIAQCSKDSNIGNASTWMKTKYSACGVNAPIRVNSANNALECY